MPASQITRQRVVDRSSCILGFTGNQLVLSAVFDATTLSPDGNGFYTVPSFSLVTKSTSDPTKIKVYEGLGSNVDAKQTISSTGTVNSGHFTLTFNGQTTANIPYNATAAQVVSALEALSNVGAGNVAGTGGALPTSVVIEFENLLGNQPIPTMTVTNTLTGSTPNIAVATTTTGQTAEEIFGVFDNMEADLFGNAVNDDEAVPVYADWTTFDTTKIQNWLSYGTLARTALPQSSFRP